MVNYERVGEILRVCWGSIKSVLNYLSTISFIHSLIKTQ